MKSGPERNGQQFLTRLLRCVRNTKQRELGDAVGWDPSKTSRVLANECPALLVEVLEFMAHAGVAVIDAPGGDTVTVSRSHYEALVTLASERMERLQGEGA